MQTPNEAVFDPLDGLDILWYWRTHRRAGFPAASPGQCRDHYAANGGRLLLSPNLAFDEFWYRRTYPQADAVVRASEFSSGWEHYLRRGAALHYNPAWWFDERWYQQNHPEVLEAIACGALSCGFEHYLLYGIRQDLAPSLYFNPEWYRRRYMTAETARRRYPIVDYLLSMHKAGRCPVAFFDETWYVRQYLPGDSKEVDQRTELSAFEHYVFVGRNRAYSPSPRFNEFAYREMNPAVQELIRQGRYASGFEHYVKVGILDAAYVPTHFDNGGVDYAGPALIRNYELSLRLNFHQCDLLRRLVDGAG